MVLNVVLNEDGLFMYVVGFCCLFSVNLRFKVVQDDGLVSVLYEKVYGVRTYEASAARY